MFFREVEVIRQVALPDKTRFLVLNVPGESIHFLICRSCGSITELQPGIHCESMENATGAKHGCTKLYHELQFFGLCPECQRKPSSILCVKLPVRGCVGAPTSESTQGRWNRDKGIRIVGVRPDYWL